MSPYVICLSLNSLFLNIFVYSYYAHHYLKETVEHVDLNFNFATSSCVALNKSPTCFKPQILHL